MRFARSASPLRRGCRTPVTDDTRIVTIALRRPYVKNTAHVRGARPRRLEPRIDLANHTRRLIHTLRPRRRNTTGRAPSPPQAHRPSAVDTNHRPPSGALATRNAEFRKFASYMAVVSGPMPGSDAIRAGGPANHGEAFARSGRRWRRRREKRNERENIGRSAQPGMARICARSAPANMPQQGRPPGPIGCRRSR